MDEVIEKLPTLVAYENEWWFRVQVLNYLIGPEILSNLGVQLKRGSTLSIEHRDPSATVHHGSAAPIGLGGREQRGEPACKHYVQSS